METDELVQKVKVPVSLIQNAFNYASQCDEDVVDIYERLLSSCHTPCYYSLDYKTDKDVLMSANIVFEIINLGRESRAARRIPIIGLELYLYDITDKNPDCIMREIDMLLEDLENEEEKLNLLFIRKMFMENIKDDNSNDDVVVDDCAYFDLDSLVMMLEDMIKRSTSTHKKALLLFRSKLIKDADNNGDVIVEINTVSEMIVEWKRVQALRRIESIFMEMDFFAEHDVIPQEKFFEELKLMRACLDSNPNIQDAIDKKIQSASKLAGT